MTDTPDDAKRRQIDAMYQKARQSFPDVSEITADELQALKASENVVLVDVRSDQEQAVSMIPGAITSAYFEEHQPDYRGAAVAVYCTVGQRSGNYAKMLQADGWRVFNLKGTILAWTQSPRCAWQRAGTRCRSWSPRGVPCSEKQVHSDG